jgi:hypothetical protein
VVDVMPTNLPIRRLCCLPLPAIYPDTLFERVRAYRDALGGRDEGSNHLWWPNVSWGLRREIRGGNDALSSNAAPRSVRSLGRQITVSEHFFS